MQEMLKLTEYEYFVAGLKQKLQQVTFVLSRRPAPRARLYA